MLKENMHSEAGGSQPLDIRLSLYRTIIAAGAGLAIFSIVGNYIGGFPAIINYKWVFLFLICTIAFLFSKSPKYTSHMFGVFIFIIGCFLPFAFIDSGGSKNNAVGYIFLLLISITYLFSGWKRIFLVIMLITVFISLYMLEFCFPDLIPVYADSSQLIDSMFQIPLLISASFLILLRFAKEYERVNQKLVFFANYDELTGLCNRRMFNKAMEKAMECRDQPTYLVLLDLDHFKIINDNHGHHRGDEVLVELSGLLKQHFDLNRQVVSRWGGDEFAIIYSGPKDELVGLLDNVSALFYTYVKRYEESAGVSTSIVSFSDFESETEALIAADHLLYAVKNEKAQPIIN
ncbi:GGDEF domain-containing protein [Desulfosporosinus youngiae]|uniref:Diguanylate cyclase (GGDEF) domain-containing protein n=1 Tax=Desulfosporosinus youngiae DSM 17734 TaxID=768710 RepID=H5Y5J2_9FIRM|nr:GGDEF domain-containing protein [Desulfosporosinus youngiae]EHQ90579.1 diguanylate cyclase (GGDEF) domain-containing protein [Desulfosporosinus youngiae DSM 17734]